MSSAFKNNDNNEINDEAETNRIQVSLYVAFNVHFISLHVINVNFLSSSNSFFLYDISRFQVSDSMILFLQSLI